MNYFSLPGLTKTSINGIDIDNAVCTCTGIPFEDMMKRTRKREIVEARQIDMILRRFVLKQSYAVCGKTFLLDHATVLHAERNFNNHYFLEHDFRMRIIAILKTLGLPVNYIEKKLENKN